MHEGTKYGSSRATRNDRRRYIRASKVSNERAPSDTLLKQLQSACMSLETSPMGFQSLPPTTILLSPRCPDPQLRPIALAIEISNVSNVSNVGRSLIWQ